MKTLSTKAIVLILILFAVYSCEKEEIHETIISELEPEKQELSNVSSKDIPEVMNFLRQDGKSKLDFPVYRNGSDINKSDNEDLILTTIELNNIKKLTNSQGLSSYSFQLTFENHQNIEGYNSIFNLVVKELSTGDYYSYIQEFRVENTWLLSNNLQTDMPSYTGFMLFYNTEGEFLINLELSNGTLVNYEETGKCDAGDGTGSGSGGGSGAGPGDGGNGSISDGGSSPGTGGPGGGFGGPIGGIGWYCYHRGEYHQSPDFCNHPEEGGQWVIKSLILKEKGEKLLKNGCVEVPEECFNDVQDPSECDGNGGCIEENDEVPINVFPISIALVHELNSLLDEGLLPSQVQAMGPYGDEFFQQMINFLNENPTAEAQNFIHAVAETIEEVGSEGEVEVDFEDRIINNLEGKSLEVYNNLKNLSFDFKNLIKKFEPTFPVSHLKFDLGDLGTARGQTIAPNSSPGTPNSPNYVITVTLNNNTSPSGVDQRPELLVAKTIIHEVIHAEMFRKLLYVLDSGGTITGVTRQDILDALDGDFPGMYDYYRRHKNWQHQQMATHYRETLASALQEYDTGIPVPDNQQPAQLYMDLSWEGLRYPNIDTWSNLSETEKDRINDVIADYIANN